MSVLLRGVKKGVVSRWDHDVAILAKVGCSMPLWHVTSVEDRCRVQVRCSVTLRTRLVLQVDNDGMNSDSVTANSLQLSKSRHVCGRNALACFPPPSGDVSLQDNSPDTFSMLLVNKCS